MEQTQRTYTEVLARKEAVGVEATWTPGGMKMDLEAFQLMVERLGELGAAGLVHVVDQHHAFGGEFVDRVKFKRLRD